MRLLLLVALLACFVPAPVHAAPVPCDEWLYLAGVGKAFLDPTPAPPLPLHWHWHYEESPYTADYWVSAGVAGTTYTLRIQQGKRTVGYAVNWQWRTCAPGKGWKGWLTS